MAALLSVKTQECIVGVRPDGLYTMDARSKKQGNLHKDVVAEVKCPSGSIIVKQKGDEYILHVNTCTAIKMTQSIGSESAWLCSVTAGTMCNNIYMNGDIIGNKLQHTITPSSGISVKFDSGSIRIEEDRDSYITTTETTFSDKKVLPGEKKSRKRAGSPLDSTSSKSSKPDTSTQEGVVVPHVSYQEMENILHGFDFGASVEPILVPYAESQIVDV